MNAESLISDLRKFHPFDKCEASHADSILDLLSMGEQAWNRDNYTPGHLTASAFVVDVQSNSVALIFHGKLKRWLQPGGHVDPTDADALSAARRELQEETGLNLNGEWHLLDMDVHVIPSRPAQPEHKHFDLRFGYLLSSGKLPAIAGADDAIAACWKPLSFLLDSGEAGLIRCCKKLEIMMRRSREL